MVPGSAPAPGASVRAPRTEILLDAQFSQNLAAAKRVPARESLPEVAETFLKSLKNPE